jgi:putative DNA methylase
MGSGEGWKGAAGLAADVRYYGEWMRDEAWKRIGHLYPKHNGETVIAWLWARTVKCPNPACGCQMPLVRSFELSKKQGKRAWLVPETSPKNKGITFTVKTGNDKPPEGTVNRRGARCVRCSTPVPFDYIRAEGKAGRMSAQLMAIVTEGDSGRNYYAPTVKQQSVAQLPIPDDAPNTDLPEQALGFRVQLYGMTKHRDLFTPRQLIALTTFSDLVDKAREQCYRDATAAIRMSDLSAQSDTSHDDVPLRDGGAGARAYAEGVCIYLALAIDRVSAFWSNLSFWSSHIKDELVKTAFGRQAIPMVWDFAEANPFCDSGGNWDGGYQYVAKAVHGLTSKHAGFSSQKNATELNPHGQFLISTDPP